MLCLLRELSWGEAQLNEGDMPRHLVFSCVLVAVGCCEIRPWQRVAPCTLCVGQGPCVCKGPDYSISPPS